MTISSSFLVFRARFQATILFNHESWKPLPCHQHNPNPDQEPRIQSPAHSNAFSNRRFLGLNTLGDMVRLTISRNRVF